MAGKHRRKTDRRVTYVRYGGAALAASGAVALVAGTSSHLAPANTANINTAEPFSSSDASSQHALGLVTPVTQPQPIHADVTTVAEKTTPALTTRVVSQARSWLGSPYAWGGNSKDGVDCSGLVQQVLKSQGVSAPRTAAAQAKWTDRISKSEARAGDLVFGVSERVHHVGIYLGDGKMIDAPTEGSSVGVHKLYSDMTLFGRIPT